MKRVKKAEHQNRAYSFLAFFSELPISSPGRTPLPTHPHNLINTDTVTQRKRERERGFAEAICCIKASKQPSTMVYQLIMN
jgi:hypothetical protein